MTTTLDRIRKRYVALGVADESTVDRIGVKAQSADQLRVESRHNKQAGADDFFFVATANTARLDLDQEVVIPKGADTSYFFDNRTLFYNHDYDLPVGKLVSARLTAGGEWIIRGFISSASEFCVSVRKMMDEGVINGVSIGFMAQSFGPPTSEEKRVYGPAKNVIREWMWLETSPTPMPCNIDALVQSVSQGKVKRKYAVMMGLPDTPDRKHYPIRPVRTAPSKRRLVVLPD